jgi:hypothetical protein
VTEAGRAETKQGPAHGRHGRVPACTCKGPGRARVGVGAKARLEAGFCFLGLSIYSVFGALYTKISTACAC